MINKKTSVQSKQIKDTKNSSLTLKNKKEVNNTNDTKTLFSKKYQQ